MKRGEGEEKVGNLRRGEGGESCRPVIMLIGGACSSSRESVDGGK